MALIVYVDASGCMPEDITVESRGHIIITEVGRRERQDRRGYFLRKTRRSYLLPSYADVPRAQCVLTEEGILTVLVPVKKGVVPCKERQNRVDIRRCTCSGDAEDRSARVFGKDGTVIARLPTVSGVRNPAFDYKAGPSEREDHVLSAVSNVRDVSMPSYALKECSTAVLNTASDLNADRVQKHVDKCTNVASNIRSLPGHQDRGRSSIATEVVSALRPLPTQHDSCSSSVTAHIAGTFKSRTAEEGDHHLDAHQHALRLSKPSRFQHTGQQLNIADRSGEPRSLPIQQDNRHSRTTAAIPGNSASCSDEGDDARSDVEKNVFSLPKTNTLQHQDRQSNAADRLEEPTSLGNVDLSCQLEAAGDGHHVVETQGLAEGNLAFRHEVLDNLDDATGTRHRSTERAAFCCIVL